MNRQMLTRCISLLFSLLTVFPCALFAQNEALPYDFNARREQLNQRGMLALGAWSVANVAGSGTVV